MNRKNDNVTWLVPPIVIYIKNGPDNSGSQFIIGDPRLRGDDNCGLFHESAVDGLVFL